MTTAKTRRPKAPEPPPLTLQGDLRLNGCAELRRLLQEVLQAAGKAPLQLDASEVSGIDTAALQLLTVFANTCRQRNLEWQWQGASDALRQGSRLLGLDEILAMPATPAK